MEIVEAYFSQLPDHVRAAVCRTAGADVPTLAKQIWTVGVTSVLADDVPHKLRARLVAALHINYPETVNKRHKDVIIHALEQAVLLTPAGLDTLLRPQPQTSLVALVEALAFSPLAVPTQPNVSLAALHSALAFHMAHTGLLAYMFDMFGAMDEVRAWCADATGQSVAAHAPRSVAITLLVWLPLLRLPYPVPNVVAAVAISEPVDATATKRVSKKRKRNAEQEGGEEEEH